MILPCLIPVYNINEPHAIFTQRLFLQRTEPEAQKTAESRGSGGLLPGYHPGGVREDSIVGTRGVEGPLRESPPEESWKNSYYKTRYDKILNMAASLVAS